MAGESKKVARKTKYSTFKAIEKIHPHKMILYLSLIGSFLIFFFMTFAYLVSRPEDLVLQNFVFPKSFSVSTVIMLFSTYTVGRVINAFSKDQLSKMKDFLAVSLALALIFAVCQFIGWLELNKSGFYLSQSSSVSFLYVITGLHLLHMGIGIAILAYYLFKNWRMIQDPVKTLIVTTNPYEKVKLEMFSTFWHCIGFFWLFIYFFFLFSL